MKAYNFVFDMDGTLIDHEQKLKEGVVEMFQTIADNSPNATFTIASGARFNQILKTVNNINAGLKDRQINFNIISNTGAIIYQNDKIEKNHLDSSLIEQIFNIIKKYDENFIVLFRGTEEDYYLKQDNPEIDKIVKKNAEMAKNFGIIAIEKTFNELSELIKNQDVLSLEIVPSKNKNKIFEEIYEFCINNKLNSSNAPFAIEISKLGKINAMAKIFNKKNEQGEIVADFDNVVYMGDGANDVEAFKVVGISFGIGDDLDVVKHSTFAIENYKQATDFLFQPTTLDLYSISKKRISLLERYKLAETYSNVPNEAYKFLKTIKHQLKIKGCYLKNKIKFLKKRKNELVK